MAKNQVRTPKWDAAHPGVHVKGDPDCDCCAYTDELRMRLQRSLADVETDREFRASAEDFEGLVAGTISIHDLCLRESLVRTLETLPRELLEPDP